MRRMARLMRLSSDASQRQITCAGALQQKVVVVLKECLMMRVRMSRLAFVGKRVSFDCVLLFCTKAGAE